MQYPKSPANKGPFLVYLTARNKERGDAALQGLFQDDQLLKAKALSKDGGLTEIKYHPLDISQTKSIQELRDFLEHEHPQGIDVLINNAGIAMDGFGRLHVTPESVVPNLYDQTRTLSRQPLNATTTARSKPARIFSRSSSLADGS